MVRAKVRGLGFNTQWATKASCVHVAKRPYTCTCMYMYCIHVYCIVRDYECTVNGDYECTVNADRDNLTCTIMHTAAGQMCIYMYTCTCIYKHVHMNTGNYYKYLRTYIASLQPHHTTHSCTTTPHRVYCGCLTKGRTLECPV